MSLLPGAPPPVGQGDPADGSVDVLVVDDDEDIRVSLDRGLRLSGFSVLAVADGPAALRVVAARSPRCIVLDVDLPGLSGVDVVANLRQREIQTPVCMLSALATVDDRVAGLAAGADDYLVKPFALSELVARLRALLRRVPDQPAHRFAVGVLTLDTGERTATVAGRAIDLTKREFELLEVLVRHPRMVLSREQLLSSVWGYEFAVDTNVVDVFVGYLRRKLESGGEARMVHTVRGVGFVLRPPA